MGVIRFLLAVCVFVLHSPFPMPHLLNSELAVRSFFVISGFYMALILNEKYHSYGVFISNRLLRLYPIYLIVLVITFIFTLHKFDFINPAFWSGLNTPSLIFVVFTNVFIIGQDIVTFMAHNVFNGSLYFTAEPGMENFPLDYYLLIPQAWSISIELMFYAVAPFIVRRGAGWIMLIILLGLMLRLVMGAWGLNYDPWVYRVFPLELVSFSLGIMAYKVYRYIKDPGEYRFMAWVLYFSLIAYTLGFAYIPGVFIKESFVLYPIVLAMAIPFIFSYFKSNKWDRYIGDLSYPIYICHWLIIGIVQHYIFYHLNEFFQNIAGWLTLMAVIVFSMALLKFVSDPIDRYRQSRVNSGLL